MGKATSSPLARGGRREPCGAVVNLGALGVVTRLTLDLQPAFHVRQDVFRELPLAALETHFDEIMSSAYSASVFTAWQTQVEQVWLKSVAEPGSTFAARDSLFEAWPARENMHPIAGLDTSIGPADGRCRSGLRSASPFPHGFTPASGDELEVEYFVPREHVVAAIRTLRRHSERLAPLLLVGEIRTVAADELWMSPCYRTACVAFHFSFKQDWPALQALLPGLEEALRRFIRVRTGERCSRCRRTSFRALYPRLADFKALLHAHDPAANSATPSSSATSSRDSARPGSRAAQLVNQ